MGCVVKLLAICERVTGADGDEACRVRVHPAMIPRTHPLAGVREAFNAVFVEAEAAGELMFYGRGAGGAPTASAVLGDLVAVARNRVAGGRGPGESTYADLPVRPMGEVADALPRQPRRGRPAGVLAPVAGASPSTTCRIETVRQQDGRRRRRATLVDRHPPRPRRRARGDASTALARAGHRAPVDERDAGRRRCDVEQADADARTSGAA